MDASKLTNESRVEVSGKHSAPESKSGQPSAVRSEAKKSTGNRQEKKLRQNVRSRRQSRNRNRRSWSAVIAEVTTCRPVSSNDEIADAANASASAMDRRRGRRRRKSRSRFAQGDDRGWARKKPGPAEHFDKTVLNSNIGAVIDHWPSKKQSRPARGKRPALLNSDQDRSDISQIENTKKTLYPVN